MGYMLITVRDILGVEILTKIFDTKEEAYSAMREELLERFKMNNNEKYMNLVEDGIEFSNTKMTKDSAYIYQKLRDVWHHWKIVEI